MRKFGCNAPVGLVYSINPFLIVFLVPFVGALTTDMSHFDMIHYGSYISALSPFWMLFSGRKNPTPNNPSCSPDFNLNRFLALDYCHCFVTLLRILDPQPRDP